MDSKSSMIMEDIDVTRAALADKLETLEDTLRDNVQTAKDRVEDTIETVKTSVRQFSPTYQTLKRPLLMVGGTAVLGLLAGRMLQGRPRRYEPPTRDESFSARQATIYSEPMPGEQSVPASKYDQFHPVSYREVPATSFSSSYRESSLVSVWNKVQENFPEEVKLVKAIVLGKALSTVGDYAKSAAPKWEEEIEQIVDSAIHTLGGQPVHRSQPIATNEPDIENEDDSRPL